MSAAAQMRIASFNRPMRRELFAFFISNGRPGFGIVTSNPGEVSLDQLPERLTRLTAKFRIEYRREHEESIPFEPRDLFRCQPVHLWARSDHYSLKLYWGEGLFRQIWYV